MREAASRLRGHLEWWLRSSAAPVAAGRRAFARRHALAAIAAAIVVLVAAPSSVLVRASHQYYPYACPFGSASRDFNGDMVEGPTAVWNPMNGLWTPGTGEPNAAGGVWGSFGDIPTPGDYNGDGRADRAIWRPTTGTWWIQCSSLTNCPGGTIVVNWGLPGDLPVPADYNGDGRADYGIWRPSTGVWYIRSGAASGASLTPAAGVAWGQYGDCPVAGRPESDSGPLRLNVWRPSNGTWYNNLPYDGSPGFTYAYAFGTYGDIPFMIDINAEYEDEVVMFRPSTGVWYGGLGTNFAVAWGQPGDIPIPRTGLLGSHPGALTVWRPGDQRSYSCFAPLGGACTGGTTVDGPTGVPGAVPLTGRSVYP